LRRALAPLAGKAVVEISADLPIELVDIHGVYAVIEALVFRLQPGDRLLVLATLVGMALNDVALDTVERFAERLGVHLDVDRAVQLLADSESDSEPCIRFLASGNVAAIRRAARRGADR
jgi:hypothetical protein